MVLHPERFGGNPAEDSEPLGEYYSTAFDLTSSEYKSFLRSIQSLKRKGILESEIQGCDGRMFHYTLEGPKLKRGGSMFYKEVRLIDKC